MKKENKNKMAEELGNSEKREVEALNFNVDFFFSFLYFMLNLKINTINGYSVVYIF